MRIGIGYGRELLEIDVPDDRVVGVQRQAAAPPLADPVAAVHAALETPLGFPALRRALTPDDHVAIVVDEHLPRLPHLLTALLEHITQAQVRPEAITLVCPPSDTGQPWVDDLPDAFEEIRLEIHDPGDRQRLSYLATTRHNRRVYLNRTVVDADQVVILTGRGYDPFLGYAGAEGILFPWLSDEVTRQEAAGHVSMKPPAKNTQWHQAAVEVAWLLGGASFLVQVIEGAEQNILHVLGGPVETSSEGQRLLDARWQVEVDRPADVVVAGISGDTPFGTINLARALGCAARVVKPRGKIALLSAIDPHEDKTLDCLRRTESPEGVLQYLRHHASPDMQAPFLWASAAEQATVYLLSKMTAETAEELFTVPMDHAGQVKRLLDAAESCVFLPDAHKTMAVVKK